MTELGTAQDPTEINNYFVLTLLMAGVIDDFQEALNEILRAANLPVSIIIVKIGALEHSENDSTLLMEGSSEVFKQCERVFVNLIDFEPYKEKKIAPAKGEKPEPTEPIIDMKKFQYDLVKNLPSQIEKFFELQHVDFDETKQVIQAVSSPVNTVVSSESLPGTPTSMEPPRTPKSISNKQSTLADES